jgi:hypothetical protein
MFNIEGGLMKSVVITDKSYIMTLKMVGNVLVVSCIQLSSIFFYDRFTLELLHTKRFDLVGDIITDSVTFIYYIGPDSDNLVSFDVTTFKEENVYSFGFGVAQLLDIHQNKVYVKGFNGVIREIDLTNDEERNIQIISKSYYSVLLFTS